MSGQELYPELVDYIYWYESYFMTADESEAQKSAIHEGKSHTPQMITMMKRSGWISEKPEVRALLADGFQAFKLRTVERIYALHKNRLNLNLCPKCGKVARTPLAKQCRFCFYDWHNPDRITEIS